MHHDAAALKYRPEIDGLRAFAVIPVMLFHAGLELFAGGFVGVDVFYAISGYLITTIIVRGREQGGFTIVEFYERRARRLLPALFVVLCATTVLALFWLAPWPLRDYGQSLAATALFSSNFLFWHESGYFQTASELKPLLHTWSLAIEEQFYLLFPPILMLALRFPVRRLAIGFSVALLVGLAVAEWGVRTDPTSAFFLLPFRAWELLVGVVVALVLHQRPQPTGLAAELGSAAGLAAVIGSALLFTDKTPTPSLWTLIPVGGAGLIILCASPRTVVGRFLSLRPFVLVGLISYSAYLWHQPLFALARARSVDEPGAPVLLALAAVSLVLAWLTWKFIEAPVRDRNRFSRKVVFAGAAFQMVFLVGLGGALVATNGLPQRLSPEARTLWEDIRRDASLPTQCARPITDQGGAACVLNPDGDRRLVVWGDSHGSIVSRALAQRGWAVENLTHFGCQPLGVLRQGPTRKKCDEANQRVFAYLQTPGSPDIVVLSARWAQILEPGHFDNGEGGIDDNGQMRLFVDGGQVRAGKAEITADMRRTVAALTAAGKTVIIVGNVPEAGWHVAFRKLKLLMFRAGDDAPLGISAAVVARRNASTEAAFAPLLSQPRVGYVDAVALYCDPGQAGRCRHEEGGRVLYRDDDHLSTFGAVRLIDAVEAAIAASAPSGGTR